MRSFLTDNDQFKISLLVQHADSYHLLSALFFKSGKPMDAPYVIELGRGRALADLMSARYSVEKQISVNPQSLIGIERTSKKKAAAAVYTFPISFAICLSGSLNKTIYFSEQ